MNPLYHPDRGPTIAPMTDHHDALLLEHGPTPEEREQLRSVPFYEDLDIREMSMSELFRVYRLRRHCRLAASREEGGEHFTYQIVWFEEQAQKARRNYVSFGTARDAVRFFLEWSVAQRGPETTCLMECGPAAVEENRLRKMVDDLDGKFALMGELGLLGSDGWECVERQVREYAVFVSNALVDIGFLSEPCSFAIATRHVPGAKGSWHITYHAYATHRRWNQVAAIVSLWACC